MSYYRPLYSSSFFPRMSFAPMSSLLDDALWGPSFSSLYWDEPEPASTTSTSSSNKQRRLQQDSAPSTSGKSGSGTAVATRNDSGKQVSSRQRPGLSLFSPLLSGAGMPEMAVDVTSTAQAYNVHASVPGIDKRDISVTVEDGNILRIQAERRSQRERRAPTTSSDTNANQKSMDQKPMDKEQKPAEQKPVDEHKAGNVAPSAEAESTAMQTDNESGEDLQYHHVESFYGRVERRMQLPDDVDVNGLTAKHENGVLSITIPRIQEKRPQQRRIEVA